MEHLDRLVKELCTLPDETEWVEFKHNNYDPDMIGADISALANSAAIKERDFAYMVWGIDDGTHEIIGTDRNLQNITVGKEELANWLCRMLSKNVIYSMESVDIDGKNISILVINKAAFQPVTFKMEGYVRVGSNTKKLRELPNVEAQLWNRFLYENFEEQIAKGNLEISDVLSLLDYTRYLDMNGIKPPSDNEGRMYYLIEDGLVSRQDNGLYSITNMGAILFAKNLNDFPTVSRKALRIVQYSGLDKMQILKHETRLSGYACDMEAALNYIEALLPSREDIVGAVRETVKSYPTIEIRETLANALIHQDFSVTGAGPTVEIFDNRIEITNPGTLLVDVMRLVDHSPKSRNAKIAGLMRRMRLCEELGTGWDRIISSCENMRLPAPKVYVYEDSVRVTLYSEVRFTELCKEDRLWACYMHACVKHVYDGTVTNSSVRDRFGLAPSYSATVSRLLKECVEKKLLKLSENQSSNKYSSYQPYWA